MSGSLAGLGRVLVGRVAGLVVVVSLWVLVVGVVLLGRRRAIRLRVSSAGWATVTGSSASHWANGPAGVAVMASTGEVFTGDAGQASQPRSRGCSALVRMGCLSRALRLIR